MRRATVARIVRSLRGLPSLRFIALIIDMERSDTEDDVRNRLRRSFMKPTEDAILELGTIKSVTVELTGMQRSDNHALFLAQWKASAFPLLHEKGILV